MSANETIRIKYHSDQIEKLRYIDGKSDWIDLRVAEEVSMKKGDFRLTDPNLRLKQVGPSYWYEQVVEE